MLRQIATTVSLALPFGCRHLSASACSTPLMQNDGLTAIITANLSKMPQWIRHDLAATDRTIRPRAEESLAAVIAAARGQSGSETH